ncbi:MAG: GTPase HflX, partial [Holdemanella sp.]|nr:GTPase HflX [Holdemanella sp.]
LKGSYLQLDRQRGGGHNKGSGEKQIEIDTRNITKQISQREKELKELEKQRSIQRNRRNQSGIKKVALVGYTNTGKSSILNQVMKYSKKEEKLVFEKNMLFATLTTNTREVVLSNNHRFLLSDTVGFVSNLPHDLVEAFHSTLEEVKEADLLIHVLDDHSKRKDIQLETTNQTIETLQASNIPVLYVYNKRDLSNKQYPLAYEDKVYISAKEDASTQFLLHEIDRRLFKDISVKLLIPYSKGSLINKMNSLYHVLFQENREDGIYLEVEMDEKDFHLVKEYAIHELSIE